jgi:hypothetical protein
MLGNSWVAAQLVASQEGLNSMELVIRQVHVRLHTFWEKEMLYHVANLVRTSIIIEIHGRMESNASYSERRGLQSRAGDQLH